MAKRRWLSQGQENVFFPPRVHRNRLPLASLFPFKSQSSTRFLLSLELHVGRGARVRGKVAKPLLAILQLRERERGSGEKRKNLARIHAAINFRVSLSFYSRLTADAIYASADFYVQRVTAC